jgi:hypothetical protein
MTAHRVDLNAEMNQIAAEARSAIFESLAFAMLCDRFGRLPDEVELPPAGLVIQLGGPNVDLARDTFGTRGVGYAIVTMIGVCEQYLPRLWLAAQLGTRMLRRPERTLRAERFFRLRDQAEGLSQGKNVNGLVDDVLAVVGATRADLPSASWLADIYALRNCLVHRGGIVDEVAAPSGSLRVMWRRLVLLGEGGAIEALPLNVEKGGVLNIGYRDAQREWKAGERVALTIQDCADVAHSLVGFVNEIGNLVDARLGAMSGRSPAEPAASPPTGGDMPEPAPSQAASDAAETTR